MVSFLHVSTSKFCEHFSHLHRPTYHTPVHLILMHFITTIILDDEYITNGVTHYVIMGLSVDILCNYGVAHYVIMHSIRNHGITHRVIMELLVT